MNKDYIILGLSAFLSAALIFVVYGFISKDKVESTEKVVYVEKPILNKELEKRLLLFGVSDAWVQTYGSNIKADCFTTELVNGDSLYTFCKLRKKLAP